MSLPVLDTFAEHGFSIFQSPEATFADFFAAGIFRRAGIDVEAGAPRLQQREALLDVALYHGLSSIIGAYVLALDKKKEFLLKEPVAVQTWAAKHVTALAATATTALDQLFVGGKPNVDLGAHLRSLRGLCHVLKALTDRLELAAGPVAVPEAAALTQEARSYLDQLLRTLHDTTLRFSFGQWLVEESATHKVHYDAAGLSRRFHTQAPLVLAAICDAAQVAPLSPPPSTGLALWQTLYTPTATSIEVSSAILLFVGLEMLASCAKPKAAPQPLATLQATTRRLARALHLNDVWSRSILGLWCLQYNVHATEAATLLQPSHLLDRSILLALVHVLLRHQQPSLAWQLWSTTPASEDAVDLLLELHLAMTDVEGAWRLLRAFPHQNAERLPQLLAWHVANDSLRHWVLRLHWSPTELPLVHAFLLADDRHHELLVRLYLGRCDYDQAYALAHALPSVANHAALQALLKATQLNQTAGDVLPTHVRALADTSDAAAYAPGLYSGKRSTTTVKVTATARTLALDEPVTPPSVPIVVASTGPKPSKDRYAAFGWSATPQKGATLENRNALVVGPSLSAAPAGPAADLMTSTHQVLRYNFVEPATTVSAPRILRTPQSTSKVGKGRRHSATDEPLHAPAARDLFTTPDRNTQPREANSTPSLRRNPVRSVRMHT